MASALQAAIYNSLNGANGISGWRWMFVSRYFSNSIELLLLEIIDGIITMVYALAGIWLIPDFPTHVK
jgi:hypothetical protein